MSAPLLTTTDLAAILGIDPDTAETLRRRNHWPHVRISRKPLVIRYTQAQADAIVAQHTVTAPNPAPPRRVEGQTARSAARSA